MISLVTGEKKQHGDDYWRSMKGKMIDFACPSYNSRDFYLKDVFNSAVKRIKIFAIVSHLQCETFTSTVP